MSIVPREVVDEFVEDMRIQEFAARKGEGHYPERMSIYIANRAAEWALEQAIEACESISTTPDTTDYSEGCRDTVVVCAEAIRALLTQSGNLKGGESDGQG